MVDLTRIKIDPTRFKKAREDKGLTQEAVADAIGVGKGLISKIERDEGLPSAQVLARLCLLLEIDISDLTAKAA